MRYLLSCTCDSLYSNKNYKLFHMEYIFISRKINTYSNWNIIYRSIRNVCPASASTCWSPLHSSRPHKLAYVKSTKRVILPKAD